MCRKSQVSEQERLRVRHSVLAVKMVVLSRHKQNLEPREKNHVCGSAECAQVWRSFYIRFFLDTVFTALWNSSAIFHVDRKSH